MSPRRLFRVVAIAEAVTWAVLLGGMFLKYVTETTEVVVSIGGMAHGIVFIAYLLVTVAVAIDAQWRAGRTLVGLLAAIPPFFTVWFDLAMEKRGALPQEWRLRRESGTGPTEKLVGWLVRKPLQGAAVGVVAVGVLTGAALLVGPPAGS